MINNILVVYGTRPEAIKLAPLIKALQSDDCFNVTVCVTGQHLELLEQVNSFFDIQPDYDLKLMSPNQSLNVFSSKLLAQLSDVIRECNPDLILVQGDTTTSFIAALAGYYEKVKVGHVEAGLRSFNLEEPYPEEGNRMLTSRIAYLHFAPTKRNVENLLRENISPEFIYETGNTVVDALHLTLNLLERKGMPSELYTLAKKINEFEKLILVTAHRRENFGQGIMNICDAILELADCYPDALFIFPVHPNPNVKTYVQEKLNNLQNVILTNSLDYQSLIYIISKCFLILTDSGGIQEEAPSLGKPVLVLRNVTERQEAVEAGCVKLIGTDRKRIVEEFKLIYDDVLIYNKMKHTISPYGDGNASINIINAIKKHLNFSKKLLTSTINEIT